MIYKPIGWFFIQFTKKPFEKPILNNIQIIDDSHFHYYKKKIESGLKAIRYNHKPNVFK